MASTQRPEAHQLAREYYRRQIQERGIGPVIDEVDDLLKLFRQWSLQTEATFLMWMRQEVNNLAWEVAADEAWGKT